jgi:hypothetical protein
MNNETWREQCDDLLSVTNHQQARIAELESTIAAIGTVLYGVHCCIEFDEENGASRERLLAELKYVRDELAQAQAHAEIKDNELRMEEAADQVQSQARTICDLRAEIERLQAVVESCRWIPVEEEVPDDNELVLVYDEYEGPESAMVCYRNLGEWYEKASWRKWLPDVTHWRRIEPPRDRTSGESEGE